MFKKPSFAVIVTSSLLFVYSLLVIGNSPLAWFIFSISPFFVLWTTYTVIRFGNFRSKELQTDEEWRYDDIKKEELGVL